MHQIKTSFESVSAAVQQFYHQTIQFHCGTFKIFNSRRAEKHTHTENGREGPEKLEVGKEGGMREI